MCACVRVCAYACVCAAHASAYVCTCGVQNRIVSLLFLISSLSLRPLVSRFAESSVRQFRVNAKMLMVVNAEGEKVLYKGNHTLAFTAGSETVNLIVLVP